MTTLFISDLHLSAERPDIIRLFQDFLRQQASQADALYILGDLFEVWIGDDAISPELLPVIDGLRQLADSGVPLFVMAGNRDFLLGEEFAKHSNCTLLPEPCIIDLYGTPTLLMHGDTLCTDDVDYQQFRTQVRDKQWQGEFLAKSIGDRVEYARQARETSKLLTQQKPEQIMDVNQQAVNAVLQEYRVSRLIHGHTHRPAVHRHDIDDTVATRIVLGDWYTQESILRVDNNGFQLTRITQNNWY